MRSQEESDESTTQLGQTYKLDETRDILGYEADKGFQTADLDFYYQYISDSYTGNERFAFDTQWVNLNYSLDFGPDLNRRWDSRINYYTTSGAFAQSFLYADERLHIDHFQNLSTNYEYLLSNTSAEGQTDTSQTGTFQLQHRLYQSLVTTLTLQGFYDTLTQGERDFYAVELTPNYSRSIPWGGTLYLDGDGRYEIDDNHLSGSQVRVINEQHAATPSGFTLNQPFVATSTIVVVDIRGGGRLPCQLDIDYDVTQLGTLTQIVPIPTSHIIQPGDPLEVSYSYQVAAHGRYSTTTLVGNAGMTFSWIDFNLQHQQIDENLLSGQGGQFLYNLHQDQGRVEVHHEWEPVDARANALYQIYDSDSELFTLKYTLQNYGQYLTFRPGWEPDPAFQRRRDVHQLHIAETPDLEPRFRDRAGPVSSGLEITSRCTAESAPSRIPSSRPKPTSRPACEVIGNGARSTSSRRFRGQTPNTGRWRRPIPISC